MEDFYLLSWAQGPLGILDGDKSPTEEIKRLYINHILIFYRQEEQELQNKYAALKKGYIPKQEIWVQFQKGHIFVSGGYQT